MDNEMKIIDLSGEIYAGMPVFPGDPEVSIEQIQTIEKEGWNMSRIEVSSHDSTHVNAPIHMKVWGENLDAYTLSHFIGPARLYESEKDILSDEGLVFHGSDITWDIAKKVIEIRPPFIALPSKFEFDLDIEKYLLEHGIISFERLENTDKLPKKFFFHGAPLRLRAGDGSPVRAYAIIG